jgi:SNF2 family DNA or RNA helicase
MTLMVSAWGNEIERFTPELTYSLSYTGTRKDAFDMDTDVVIINTDGVKELRKNPQWLEGFTDIIIDEISYFKHRTSQRTKAMFRIRSKFKRRVGMTGTPTPISVTELWAQAYIIDEGKRLGTSFGAFRNSVQFPEQVGPSSHHIKWNDRPGAEQAVADLLSDISVCHAFEEVMKHVPPNHRNIKRFTLSKKTRVVYNQLEDEAVAMVGEDTVTAVHKAALRTKLLQVSSGAVYSTSETYTLIDRTRYELVGDLVEPIKHSLVFFSWKHQRDELVKEMKARGIEYAVLDGNTSRTQRDEICADYQRGQYQTILLHPRTGAHGLTLTRGTQTIIASPFSEADLLKQSIHRIYRGAQDQVTNSVLVEADNTIEQHVYAQLNEKYGRMLDLLSLMRLRGKVK